MADTQELDVNPNRQPFMDRRRKSVAMAFLVPAAMAITYALGGCSPKVAPSAPLHAGELSLAEEVTREPDALEIARIWKTKDGQTVILSPADKWTAEEWGVMLSDMGQHIANARGLRKPEDRQKFLDQLKRQLDKEWANPTEKVTGRIVE